MKKFLRRTLIALLLYNLSLVIITALLSFQATLDHPMIGQRVSSGEETLHVIESGSEATDNDLSVVLIHGASTSALDFSTNLLPLLSENWHVLAIDRPGHGYSDRGDAHLANQPAHQARAILDTLHELDIKNPVLVGHSWAGSVVMAALLMQHEQVDVKAGVLIAGATHPYEGGSAWHVELTAKPLIGDIFRWQYVAPIGRLSLESAVQVVFAPEKMPQNYIEDTGLTLSLRPSAYKSNSLDLTGLSAYLSVQAPLYPTISKPLLSIAASEDHVVPAWNHHDRLIKQVPQITPVMIEGAGHAPHQTRPELVSGLIDTFLRTLQ